MKKKPKPTSELIKIQVDSKTTITVRTPAAVKVWLARYPEAKIIK
jgi:hypothetical protein